MFKKKVAQISPSEERSFFRFIYLLKKKDFVGFFLCYECHKISISAVEFPSSIHDLP